jgi:tetratricopeptide (TPR) repeat protein
MYLNSQRRYTSSNRGRRGGGGCGLGCLLRIFMMLFIIGVAIGGVYILQNMDDVRPQIQSVIDSVVNTAEDGIRQIQATAPPPTRDPREDVTLAVRAWERGSMEDAIIYYENALPSLPNDIVAHYRLTMAYINQGRYQEAVEQAENTITASPYSADAWSVYAFALNRAGRSREAIAIASRALELVPETVVNDNPQMGKARARGLAVLGEAYLNLGQGALARTYVAQAIALDAESFEALNLQGRIAQELDGDINGALGFYRDAYEVAPHMTYLSIWLGRMQIASQQQEQGVETFRRVLELNPSNTLALYELARYYTVNQGNYQESYNYYTRCLNSDPNHTMCNYHQGRILLMETAMYNPDVAREHLLLAHDLNPTDPYILYWVGRSYWSLGECHNGMSYIELGQQLAREANNTQLVSDYDDLRGRCGQRIVPTIPPTPEGGETEDISDI